MISRFCVRLTSKRWVLKIVQVIMIHLMPCRLYIPSCIHMLRWSLECSVKRTWTGSAFSTNESAWTVLVTGPQSRVWGGPKLVTFVHVDPANITMGCHNLCKFRLNVHYLQHPIIIFSGSIWTNTHYLTMLCCMLPFQIFKMGVTLLFASCWIKWNKQLL